MSSMIALAPSWRRSRCRSRKAGWPARTRSPSHTPSPSTKPASNTDTIARSRGTSSPLTQMRMRSLRSSSSKSCVPWAMPGTLWATASLASMSTDADDPPQEDAKKLPTGRVARTARVGGLVTGQGVRWAGMRAANRVRPPERAAAAEEQRTAALVTELVEQLSRMRGAAMKVGQMLSMVEFDGLDEDQRDELQEKLATLRDGIPPVPFARLEKLLQKELGGPLASVF